MRLFHKIFYYFISFFEPLAPHNILISLTGQNYIFPFYHAVSHNKPIHLKHLYSVINIGQFQKDLDFILKYYHPVDLFELISFIRTGNVTEKKFFFLSFDDGLKEFYDVISPILLEKGIPATCFLNSAFIDNKDLFFRYKASILIDLIYKTDKKSNKWKILNSWFLENNMALANYKYELLKIKYDEKTKLDELGNVMEFNFKEYLEREKPYLTTRQINELIEKGFTFGAHSIDHPEYRYIPFKEQIRQTKESIGQITNQFKLKYRIFSFPFTDFAVSRQFFEEINKDNSIEFTAGCAGIKHDSIKNNIHRIPMDEYELNGRTRIKIDYFYYLVKSIFNRNKIIRE